MNDILNQAIQKLIYSSMYQYAERVCGLLRSGKSTKQAKSILTAKVKHAATPKGIDLVFKVGCAMWEDEKRKRGPIIIKST